MADLFFMVKGVLGPNITAIAIKQAWDQLYAVGEHLI